ncbi:MAG: VOC family protein [Opitutaceae bacterium]|nr:VOC family protein [Opitutaceae bacterium]
MTPSLALTAVRFRVSNLRQSRAFYTQQLGFIPVSEPAGEVGLATVANAEPILILQERPGAAPASRQAAGLFHAALLLPSRPALGHWLAWAAGRGVEFDGFSDHGVSEAIYLSDPDGIGLEFYADRPRSAWPFAGGELAMVTAPLAVPDLLAAGAEVAPTAPLAGARWGHLHLRVTHLGRSEAFYRSTLGVEVTQASYPGARFLAADGYHHHLGLNTWGQPSRPASTETTGLEEAVFARRDAAGDTVLADPDGIRLRVRPGAA